MRNFAFHNPTKIYFGKGQLAKLDEAVPRDGVILMLYGGGSIKRNGVYDQVRQALGARAVLEYGGIDSVEYQIKVQGRFPEHSDKYLLSRKSIEKRVGAPRVIGDDEPYGNLLLVDVAAGIYRDKTVAVHARVIGQGGPESMDPRRMDVMDIPIFTNSHDWTDAAAMVANQARQLSN
ncbi:MAG: hypothetical protein IH820_14170, partial [Bacteroidetes bacterium]|nr:hypothetical protein [Bacteroidota bacterium]